MLDGKASRDAVIVAIGPLGAALSSMVLTVLMSWNFAPAVLGALAILELVALFFVMICTLGLDQAYVREYATSRDRQALFAAAVTVPVVIGAAVALVLSFMLPRLGVRILSEAGSAGIVFAAIYAFAALLIRMLSVTLRMSGSPAIFSALQVAQRGATVAILAVVLLVSKDGGPKTAIACYVAGALVSVALHFAACRTEVRHAARHLVDTALFRSLLRYGFPVVFAASLYVLLSSADRLSLAFFGTGTELGRYAVALSIAGAVNIFTSIFSVIWAPMIYRNEELARDEKIIRPYLETVTCLTFISGGGVAAVAWFLPMIFPRDYAEVAFFVPACMALPLLYVLAEAFGIGIGVSRRMVFAAGASGISALTALIVCGLLVPGYGARGASFGVLVGAYCFLILRTEFGAVLWYRLPSRSMYLVAGLYFVGCVGSLFGGDRLGSFYPLCWIGFVLACGLMFHQRIAAGVTMLRLRLG